MADDSDDDEAVWTISSSLGVSVRSENCEVLHLNSNMVAASLKQSGLITDRAYNRLTTHEDTLTRNALKFLWLAVVKNHNCYNSFVEAAQALCSRAMKTSRETTNSRVHHVSNISEQNNGTGKTEKQQKQPASTEEHFKNSEKEVDLTNGHKENVLLSLEGLMCFVFISSCYASAQRSVARGIMVFSCSSVRECVRVCVPKHR